MQNHKIQRRPVYAIESVDNALRLLQMLRDENALRVSDAAQNLGVSASTAHRLLSMLVYRGFAVQDESHCYLPGPAIGASPVSVSWTSTLRERAIPHMECLRDEVGETVHLSIRVGQMVHFLATLESRAPLRVGDLKGAVLPAHRSAAGIALLAELEDEQLARMYRVKRNRGRAYLLKSEFVPLMRLVGDARRTGYGVNRERAEPGVGSIAFPLRLPSGQAIAALSAASPVIRLEQLLSPKRMLSCREAVTQIDHEILMQGIDLG